MSTAFKCAKRNDVEQLKRLISDGIDINQTFKFKILWNNNFYFYLKK